MAFDYKPRIHFGGVAFEITVDATKWTVVDSKSLTSTLCFDHDPIDILDELHRSATLARVVGWFKSEDLALLYKVLDDPQSFGIDAIEPGGFATRELFDVTAGYKACIVGALAVAKLPASATIQEIEILSNRITSESEILLSPLDAIISEGHLSEFKAEIQRQMAER